MSNSFRRMRRRAVISAVVGSAFAASPAFASSGMDGEQPGAPLSLIAGVGLFVGIPAAVIALVYFSAYVPKRKQTSTGTEIAQD